MQPEKTPEVVAKSGGDLVEFTVIFSKVELGESSSFPQLFTDFSDGRGVSLCPRPLSKTAPHRQQHSERVRERSTFS
jgi:hypothetical protein